MEGPHLADHYNTLGFSEVELRLGNRLWGKDYFERGQQKFFLKQMTSIEVNHLKEGNI